MDVIAPYDNALDGSNDLPTYPRRSQRFASGLLSPLESIFDWRVLLFVNLVLLAFGYVETFAALLRIAGLVRNNWHQPVQPHRAIAAQPMPSDIPGFELVNLQIGRSPSGDVQGAYGYYSSKYSKLVLNQKSVVLTV